MPDTHPDHSSTGCSGRVLHFIPGIYEEASGPSYTVPRLCESLLAAGVDNEIVTLDYGEFKRSMPYAKAFAIGRGPRKLGRSPAMFRYADRECREGRVSIIHNHSLWMMPNVYPGWLADRHALPHILSPRGVFTEYALSIGSKLKPAFWRLFQRPSLKSVTCFHATAETEYEDIRRMGYRQPVALIPNGIDLPTERARFDSPVRTMLFLGRVHPNKGVEILLDAWSRIADAYPDWQLRIVGSGDDEYLRDIQAQADRLAAPRTVFSGALYGDDKFAAYRDADAYILPSYSENFGVTVAEALASGIPAIVTKGAPWAGLDEHDAGLWVDLSVDSLAAAMFRICALDRDTLAQMGGNGRAWMLKAYSWQEIARQTRDIYDWMLNLGDAPPCLIKD